MFVLNFILLLVVIAAYVYWASRVVPSEVPSSLISSVAFGIIGGGLIGHFRPDLIGLSLIVCLFVSAFLLFVPSLMPRDNSRRV